MSRTQRCGERASVVCESGLRCKTKRDADI